METREQASKCSPALAKPGTKCSALSEDGEPCGHAAVMVCDHGSWCSCSVCNTVCPAAWEEWMALGEPKSPGCQGHSSEI
jgi:hypothetical protein